MSQEIPRAPFNIDAELSFFAAQLNTLRTFAEKNKELMVHLHCVHHHIPQEGFLLPRVGFYSEDLTLLLDHFGHLDWRQDAEGESPWTVRDGVRVSIYGANISDIYPPAEATYPAHSVSDI